MEYEDIKDLAHKIVDNPDILDEVLYDYSNESLDELYDELDGMTTYEDPFVDETIKKLLERISKQMIVNEQAETELEDIGTSSEATDMNKKRKERLAESQEKLDDDLERWLNGGTPPKVELTEEVLEGYSINEFGEIIRPATAQQSHDKEQQVEYTKSELEYQDILDIIEHNESRLDELNEAIDNFDDELEPLDKLQELMDERLEIEELIASYEEKAKRLQTHIAYENLGTSLTSMTPEEIASKYDKLIAERQRLLDMQEQGIELDENAVNQNNDMIEMIEGFASMSPETAELLQSHKKSNEKLSTDEKLKKVMNESDTLDSNIQSAEELLHQYESQLLEQDRNQEQK